MNTAAKAMKPGTSRKDCRMPISAPVKPALSMTKLFSSAFHVAKLKGTAPAITRIITSGRRQPPSHNLRNLSMASM